MFAPDLGFPEHRPVLEPEAFMAETNMADRN